MPLIHTQTGVFRFCFITGSFLGKKKNYINMNYELIQ